MADPQANPEKPPEGWVTSDEPMTGPQAKTGRGVDEEVGESADPSQEQSSGQAGSSGT